MLFRSAEALDPDGKRAAASNAQRPPRTEGRLVRHAKTIVTPGTGEWEVDPDSLGPCDVVRYAIRCVSMDKCKVIRSFAVALSPSEPQPPRSKTNEIVFYRAPAVTLATAPSDKRGEEAPKTASEPAGDSGQK